MGQSPTLVTVSRAEIGVGGAVAIANPVIGAAIAALGTLTQTLIQDLRTIQVGVNPKVVALSKVEAAFWNVDSNHYFARLLNFLPFPGVDWNNLYTTTGELDFPVSGVLATGPSIFPTDPAIIPLIPILAANAYQYNLALQNGGDLTAETQGYVTRAVQILQGNFSGLDINNVATAIDLLQRSGHTILTSTFNLLSGGAPPIIQTTQTSQTPGTVTVQPPQGPTRASVQASVTGTLDFVPILLIVAVLFLFKTF